jgi:hypothetical protein
VVSGVKWITLEYACPWVGGEEKVGTWNIQIGFQKSVIHQLAGFLIFSTTTTDSNGRARPASDISA